MTPIRSLALLVLTLGASAAGAHESVTNAQKRAVEEFLGAVSTADASSIAYAIHPADLEALRTRILQRLREEAERGESTLRVRLFGPAMPLAEVERLTNVTFYSTLSRKLHLAGRQYDDFRYVAYLPEGDDTGQVVVHARIPRLRGERETVHVVHVVTVKRYGRDWKAALPSEIEAQIDDLAHGRRAVVAWRPPVDEAPAEASGAGDSATPAALRERLAAAEKSLAASNCEEYYKEHMSPNFRRVISKKNLEALIASCENSIGNREMLLSTVRIVQRLEPSFEYNSRRAVYDVSGQGLPFERFALERVNRDWFIAE